MAERLACQPPWCFLAKNVDDAALGKLYVVGGYRLHLDCHGHGSPTVVLANGLGETSAWWPRTSRVFAYDRAGHGWSDEAAKPPGRPEVGR